MRYNSGGASTESQFPDSPEWVTTKVKSSQVANPRNAFCIEQRTAAKSKEAQVRVFGLFLLLPRLAPVGLIAR